MMHIVEQLLHFRALNLGQQIAANCKLLSANDKIKYVSVTIEPSKTLHIDECLLGLIYILE